MSLAARAAFQGIRCRHSETFESTGFSLSIVLGETLSEMFNSTGTNLTRDRIVCPLTGQPNT